MQFFTSEKYKKHSLILMLLIAFSVFSISCKQIDGDLGEAQRPAEGEDSQSSKEQDKSPVEEDDDVVDRETPTTDPIKEANKLVQLKMNFVNVQKSNPESICQLNAKDTVISDVELCANEEQAFSFNRPVKLYVRGVKSGHYKVNLKFSNSKVMTTHAFTHNDKLLIPFRSSFLSSNGNFSNGSLSSVEINFDREEIKLKEALSAKVDVNTLLKAKNIVYVSNAEQLRAALDKAVGGDVVVLNKDIRDKEFVYFGRKKYSSMVYLLGALPNNQAPHLDRLILDNVKNLTLINLKANRREIKLGRDGFTSDYAWLVRNSENVRLSKIHFYGSDDGLQLLKQGSIKGVFNDARAVFVRQSKEVLVDNCFFENVYQGVDFQDIQGMYAIKNVANKVTADMFSGGGVQRGIFDSNLSLTKMPVKYLRGSEQHYTHSDVIQLYTTGRKTANTNIIIKNNVALVGNSPIDNPLSAGWQCFFTRDESGDRGPVRAYTNINIYNNICVSNQHHGVTLGRGHENYVANNTILEVRRAPANITAPIKINNNRDTTVLNNVAKRVYFTNSNELNGFNNYNLGRNAPWVKEFESKHVTSDRVIIPSRGPASEDPAVSDSYLNDIKGIDLRSLVDVRF